MKKPARILSMAVAAALSASMLTACQSKEKQTYFEENSKGEIVDSALFEKIEQESQPLNTKVENYNCHSGRILSVSPSSYMTFDDKFMYNCSSEGTGGQGYLKIDLQSGEVIPLCNVAGCTHDPNDFPDCINNRCYFNGVTAVGDELWYREGNKIIAAKGDKEEVIYENKYCTEFEETESPDNKYAIAYFTVDDKNVYVFGNAYVLQLDRNTMQVLKAIDLPTEADLYAPFVYKGSIYFTNYLFEAFRTDIESGETTKLGDHILCVYVKNDTVYYADNSVSGKLVLYSADLDFKDPEKLVETAVGSFVINDNKIFYSAPDDSKVMCFDIDSGESIMLYDGINTSAYLATADYIDRVFIVGEYVDPDDTTDKYDVIASVRSDGSDLWVKRFDGVTWKN